MYHHVSERIGPGPYSRALTVSPQEFSSQLHWLRGRGCAALTVDALLREVRGRWARGCAVALTFDDGYGDAATAVAPLLAREGFVGTFYVSTGHVGAAGHLTQTQIRALAQAGNEIGAHTVSHPDLTTASSEQLRSEVRDSRAALERWIGRPVASFAYPAGRWNERVREAVRAAGYASAASTQPGRLSAATDPYALPRYRILRGSGLALLAATLGSVVAATDPARRRVELEHIAALRAEGNDPALAERIGVALLSAAFPEPILKVRVLTVPPATVAGIMLSGSKWHRAVTKRQFFADVAAMASLAFARGPELAEVDIWAIVPLAVQPQAQVSGELAVSTSRTVFSTAVRRPVGNASPTLGRAFVDDLWAHQALRVE